MNLLLALCESLEKKGIQPSVAMIRAKSVQSVALPVAIKAIQQYKQGARAKNNEGFQIGDKLPDTEGNHSKSIEDRVTQLEYENRLLRNRIDELEKKM